MLTYGFKVQLNYYFLHQELCLFFLQAHKEVAQCTFKLMFYKLVVYKTVYLKKRDDDDISGVSGEEDQRTGQRTAICHEGPEESHSER